MSNIFPPGNFTLDRSENDLSLHIHRIGAQVPNLFTFQASAHEQIESGRGASFRKQNLIIRPYLRGGMMRFISQRNFFSFSKDLLSYRPFRELQILNYLLSQGLLVPEVMAASVARSGMLYQGMIATKEISHARNLAELSLANCESEMLKRFAEKAGLAAGQVFDLGIFHPDLHPDNVLVTETGEVYLIDFDNAFKIPKNSKLVTKTDLLKRWNRYCKKYNLPYEFVDSFAAGLSQVS